MEHVTSINETEAGEAASVFGRSQPCLRGDEMGFFSGKRPKRLREEQSIKSVRS